MSACSLCPLSYFKNYTGSDLCQHCPQRSVSNMGAIGLEECHCPSGTIDLDFSINFRCDDLSALGDVVGNESFARSEAGLYSFSGSMILMSSVSLEIARLDLIDYLGLSERASLHLMGNRNQIDYKVTTSEEEEAMKLHANMEASVIAAFAIQTASTTFTSETTVTRSAIALEGLRCPDGLGFVNGIIRNQSDCKCVPGSEPFEGESGLTKGCRKCPLGKYKSIIADASCSSCGALTTLLEGSISSAACRCPAGFVNAGLAVQDIAACICSSGYEYSDQDKKCRACAPGQYKTAMGNEQCNSCPIFKTTLGSGSTSIEDCVCQAGTFDEGGSCSDCKANFFCPGTGQAEECPRNTESRVTGSRSSDACLCKAGYYLKGAACEPCERGRYKGNIGDEPCTQFCPPNADSEPGAMSLNDCFCIEGHHAMIAAGQLDRCASCSSYAGLVCKGGFDVNSSTVHMPPRADKGFYQTGVSFATKCRTVLPDGSSACLGENQCGEGTSGMLCGECPLGWARVAEFSPCDACWAGTGIGLVTISILFEITKIAASNFVLAALAAMGSANANLLLHTYMIRVFTQWITACALITHFNLELLETPFAQSLATDGDTCEKGQAQEVQKMPDSSITVRSDGVAVLGNLGNPRLSWPSAASYGFQMIFDILTLVPRIASVEFSLQCRAIELFPHRPDAQRAAQRLAPALYYISLPLLIVFATFAVSAVAVYCLVPLAQRFGVHFNEVAKAKVKTRRQIEGLLGPWVRGLDLSDVPRELPKFPDRSALATEVVANHPSFARQLCRMKCCDFPQFEALLGEEISMEAFCSIPTAFLFEGVTKQELQVVSC